MARRERRRFSDEYKAEVAPFSRQLSEKSCPVCGAKSGCSRRD